MTAYFSYIIYSIVILQFLDIASTLIAFKQGAVEVNPFMKKSIELFGNIPGLIIPKLPFIAGVWYFQSLFLIEALIVVCAIYIIIFINNLLVAYKLKQRNKQAIEHAESIS